MRTRELSHGPILSHHVHPATRRGRGRGGTVIDMTRMRAIIAERAGGPEVLQWAEVERPTPGLTEILVRVHAAGINPTDWKARSGGGAMGRTFPLILGYDVAGVVEEVGPGVTLYRPGDEVLGMPLFPQLPGAYAEYVVAPARHFVPKPASLSFEEAAEIGRAHV